MNEATGTETDWRTLWRSGVLPRFCFISLGITFHAGAENMISTVMPAVVRDIGGVQLNGWTFSIYEIGSILAGAAAGRLCTYWPIRTNMIAAAFVFALGSIAVAVSPTMEWALGGRLLSGFGGGALITLCFVAMQRYFDAGIWPQLMGVLSAVWGVSAFSGPLYGGVVGQLLGWRWAFAILAFAAILFAGACLTVLKNEPKRTEPALQGRFPAFTLACLALGITAIAAAGVENGPALSAALVAGGLVGVAAFFALDSRNGMSRLFPSATLHPNSIGGSGLTMVAAFAVSTCSFGFYGPLLLSALHNFSPITTGLIIASESVSWSILSIFVARASKQDEKMIIRAGAIMIPAGVLGFSYAVPSGSIAGILFFALLQGGGFGILWPFASRMVIEAAPAQEREITAAAYSTTQRIGYAVGGATAGIVANVNGFSEGFSKASASIAAVPLFLYFLPLALLGCFLAFRLTKLTGRVTRS